MVSFVKSDVPMSEDGWQATDQTNVGTRMWRHRQWGIGESDDGLYDAYTFVCGAPIKLEGGFREFSEAAGFIRQIGDKVDPAPPTPNIKITVEVDMGGSDTPVVEDINPDTDSIAKRYTDNPRNFDFRASRLNPVEYGNGRIYEYTGEPVSFTRLFPESAITGATLETLGQTSRLPQNMLHLVQPKPRYNDKGERIDRPWYTSLSDRAYRDEKGHHVFADDDTTVNTVLWGPQKDQMALWNDSRYHDEMASYLNNPRHRENARYALDDTNLKGMSPDTAKRIMDDAIDRYLAEQWLKENRNRLKREFSSQREDVPPEQRGEVKARAEQMFDHAAREWRAYLGARRAAAKEGRPFNLPQPMKVDSVYDQERGMYVPLNNWDFTMRHFMNMATADVLTQGRFSNAEQELHDAEQEYMGSVKVQSELESRLDKINDRINGVNSEQANLKTRMTSSGYNGDLDSDNARLAGFQQELAELNRERDDIEEQRKAQILKQRSAESRVKQAIKAYNAIIRPEEGYDPHRVRRAAVLQELDRLNAKGDALTPKEIQRRDELNSLASEYGPAPSPGGLLGDNSISLKNGVRYALSQRRLDELGEIPADQRTPEIMDEIRELTDYLDDVDSQKYSPGYRLDRSTPKRTVYNPDIRTGLDENGKIVSSIPNYEHRRDRREERAAKKNRFLETMNRISDYRKDLDGAEMAELERNMPNLPIEAARIISGLKGQEMDIAEIEGKIKNTQARMRKLPQHSTEYRSAEDDLAKLKRALSNNEEALRFSHRILNSYGIDWDNLAEGMDDDSALETERARYLDMANNVVSSHDRMNHLRSIPLESARIYRDIMNNPYEWEVSEESLSYFPPDMRAEIEDKIYSKWGGLTDSQKDALKEEKRRFQDEMDYKRTKGSLADETAKELGVRDTKARRKIRGYVFDAEDKKKHPEGSRPSDEDIDAERDARIKNEMDAVEEHRRSVVNKDHVAKVIEMGLIPRKRRGKPIGEGKGDTHSRRGGPKMESGDTVKPEEKDESGRPKVDSSSDYLSRFTSQANDPAYLARVEASKKKKEEDAKRQAELEAKAKANREKLKQGEALVESPPPKPKPEAPETPTETNTEVNNMENDENNPITKSAEDPESFKNMFQDMWNKRYMRRGAATEVVAAYGNLPVTMGDNGPEWEKQYL